MKKKRCVECGEQIAEERLEALPETELCIDCAKKAPPQLFHDPNDICARASATGRNGFAVSD